GGGARLLRASGRENRPGSVPFMHVDLLFDPFDGRWAEMREGALAAEEAGFDGVWLYDHLAGTVHGAHHVLECWTTLTAIAAAVPRTVWSGTADGVTGYLRPDPQPPIVIAGFGPKMAELAGRIGDGINAPAGRLTELVDVARQARARAGRDPDTFIVTTSAG